MASAQSTFVSRDDYKAQKALEEARKAGTAPYQVDEEGKEINPHMPQYIIQAPWYLNQNMPSLKHQRAHKDGQKAEIGQWYARGARQGEIATKFRKGACENCGSMTHKTKECCERPRKVGAKFTGKDIQPDEIVQELQLDYDAKRDRWNGYDPDMYEDVVKEYELHDQIRKKAKHEMLSSMDGVGAKDGIDQEEADFKDDEGEEHDAPVASRDPRTKTTTRQLRIREDTAKYLLNLDEKSAYYDAKSRSMRENPNAHLPADKQMFRGDNSARYTGDTIKMLEQERAVWENIDRNINPDLNTVAVPTGTELVHKTMKEKLTKEANERVQNLIDKYGSETNTNPDMTLIFGQTEKYVEFTVDGKVKRTNEPKVGGNKSRYDEDVFINDHTTVWGSWWNKELGWGYGCCHSNTKDSRCIGEKGKKNAVIREYKKVKEREEALKRAEEEAKKKGLIEDTREELKETFTQPMQKAVAQSAPATKPKQEEQIASKKEQTAPKHEAKKQEKESDDEKNNESSSSSDDDDDESSSSPSKSGSDSNSSDDD